MKYAIPTALSDIGTRERTMEQILTEIVQAARQHAEYMSEMVRFFPPL